MKSIVYFAIAMLLARDSNLQAQSLVSKLPADGSWATYSYETKSNLADGGSCYRKGTLTLKSVGKKKIKSIPHRWLEFELKLSEGDCNLVPGQVHVCKALIPEKAILTPHGIRSDLVEGWKLESWISDGVPKTYGPIQTKQLDLLSFQPIQSHTKHDKTKKEIKTPVGNLKCKCIRFEVYKDEMNGKKSVKKKPATKVECYMNDQTPFGSVMMRFEEPKDVTGFSSKTQLKLTATGTSAVSSIRNDRLERRCDRSPTCNVVNKTNAKTHVCVNDPRKPNPDIPPLVANALVGFLCKKNIEIDFSIPSLTETLDPLLNQPMMREESIVVKVEDAETPFDMPSAFSAYFGQTLANLYDGKWTGYMDSNSGINFYSMNLEFGEFSLNPTCWISFRIANGPEEGTVADWLNGVMPTISARRDLTPNTGFIEDIY